MLREMVMTFDASVGVLARLRACRSRVQFPA